MRKIEFSNYEIDLNTMALSNGRERIPMGRRTLDTLLFLVQNRHRVVPREELHRYIWRSETVSPSTIPMCIREIRKALSDDAASPRFIASAKGHGYRFIAQVQILSDDPSIGDSPSDFNFVGRRAALSALQAATASTLSDLRGRTISIIGEAGIGKTRLVSEFLRQAAGRVEVIIARAASADAGSPFAVWTQVLRTATSRQPDNKKLAECVRRLARVLPELQTKEGDAEREAEAIDRLTFPLHWFAALRSIVSQRPLILVIEDIHHADQDSLLLLHKASIEIANSPIVLIVTGRPSTTNGDDGSVAARLVGGADSALLNLAPLNSEEVRELIDPLEENREQLTAEILERSAGNAFYATYLLRLHYARKLHSSVRGPEHAVLIKDAPDIVARQLESLPPLSRDALRVASILGPRFSIAVVAATLDISIAEASERLEPAEIERVIQYDDFQYSFCHSLLQESLYWSTSKNARMQLHLAIADALEAPGSTDSSPAIVLEHLLNAFPISSATRICNLALVAGNEAISRCAFQEAQRILNTALVFTSEVSGVDEAIQCDLNISYAKALLYSGNRTASKGALLHAAELARSIDCPHRLVRCGLEFAPDFLSIEVGSSDPDLIMILQEALNLLPEDSSALRSRALARLSQALQWTCFDPSERESMSERALALAVASNDQAAIAESLAACADSLFGPDRVNERVHRILQLQAAALRRSDKYVFLVQQTRLIAALLERGDVRRVSIENDRYREIAEQTGLPQYRWYPVSTDSMLACLSGQLDLAERLAAQYRELAGLDPDENLKQTYACQYALREIERNRSKTVLPLVREFSSRHKNVLSWAAAIAWIQWDSGEDLEARSTLRQFSELDIRTMYREPGGTIGLAALAETSAYLGEKRIVRLLYDLIGPVSDRFATAGYGVAYFGSLGRYSSLLATALRKSSEAIRLARLAVDQETRIGARSWLILARLDQIRARDGRLDISKTASKSVFDAGIDEGVLPRTMRRVSESFDIPEGHSSSIDSH